MDFNFTGSSFDLIQAFDPEIADLVSAEERRQRDTINLIASENYASPLAAGLEGCIFADKNAEGHVEKRFAGGCALADRVETIAAQRLTKLFGCDHANVQAMSATVANIAVLRACLTPGDTILSMELNQGGHLSHGAKFHYSGKEYRSVFYKLDPKTEMIDYDEVERLAREVKPKMIICGASSYPRRIDYKRFGEVARSVGALLFADLAHNVGFIAAGIFESPFPYADVATSSTHKTWRGARGCGVVMCRQELAPKIDSAIFPGLQGAPKMDMIAARAVQFKESASPTFHAYAQQVLNNAQALAQSLSEEGLRLVSGGTDTHLVLVDVRSLVPTGQAAEQVLESVGIVTNKNLIPYDPQPPKLTSGLRVGASAMTTRGMDELHMSRVGKLLSKALKNSENPAALEEVRKEVRQLTSAFPLFNEKWLCSSAPK